MTVSIVIPAHNAARTLRECLGACLGQTFSKCEIILVDDGSTDDTAVIAESAGVTVIQQKQSGPAAARNTGARAANGDIVVFTDSDCVPHTDWIERLLPGFSDGIGAVGGTYGIANPHRLLARMIHEEIRFRHARFGDTVDFLGSFNLAIRRDLFLQLGGFDESFSAASGEDNDLSYRIVDSGQQLRFVRGAVVDHYHPVVVSSYLRTQARHGFWRMKIYAKHPNRSSGDAYAGTIDIIAPGAVLMLIWSLTARGNAPGLIWFRLACAVAATIVLLSRMVLTARIVFSTGSALLALYFPVLIARDLARGIGMLGGIWAFFIRRKAVV